MYRVLLTNSFFVRTKRAWLWLSLRNIVKKHYAWVIAIFSIIGVVLNIYKLPVCFAIWICTNFAWMIIDFKKKIYAQSFLFLIYFLLAIWGIITWLK
jgi:nicotinamide riboside transporter PnuC